MHRPRSIHSKLSLGLLFHVEHLTASFISEQSSLLTVQLHPMIPNEEDECADSQIVGEGFPYQTGHDSRTFSGRLVGLRGEEYEPLNHTRKAVLFVLFHLCH